MLLLLTLRPLFWFAAHLHTKFAATVPFASPGGNSRAQESAVGGVPVGRLCAPCDSDGTSSGCTRFLALDKVIPGRDFLQVIRVRRPPADQSSSRRSSADFESSRNNNETFTKKAKVEIVDRIEFDLEWLCIVKKTHYLLSTERGQRNMPFAINCITQQEIESMRSALTTRLDCSTGGGFVIPFHDVDTARSDCFSTQTDLFLSLIEKDDAFVRYATTSSNNNNNNNNNNNSSSSSSSSSRYIPTTSYNMSTILLPTADPNEIDI